MASGVDEERVLVTGGAGFVGSPVVDALLRAGRTPRIFDLRSSTVHGRGHVEAVVGDLADGRALAKAIEGCGTVIHLAAAADVGRVEAGPVEAERCNARGTLAVL